MLKQWINAIAGLAGVRIVNATWGPRGFVHSLRRMAAHGWAPKQIIDVGAYRGTWTAECMTLFPDAHYLLIEPLLANRDALTAFAATHQNVIVWHGAAGPEPGEILIHCHDDQSSALSANIVDWRGDESVTAPMRTLDSFIDSGEIDPPQFLKLDVQGFELAVLRGAKSALGSADAVLIEVSFQELYAGQPFADDIIAHMRDVGLRIHDICTYSQAKNGELLQSDLLFVRQDWQARRETIHG